MTDHTTALPIIRRLLALTGAYLREHEPRQLEWSA